MIDFIVQAWTIGRCERAFIHEVTVLATMLPVVAVFAIALILLARRYG